MYEVCKDTFGAISLSTLPKYEDLLPAIPAPDIAAITLSDAFHRLVEKFCEYSDDLTVAQVQYCMYTGSLPLTSIILFTPDLQYKCTYIVFLSAAV